MVSSVFGGTWSISCSLFKMWNLRLLSWKLKSSAPLTLFKNTWAYISFLEQKFSSLGCLNMTDVIQELCEVVAGAAVKLMQVHVWKTLLLLFLEKRRQSLVLCWKYGGISADKISVKATEVGYLLVMAVFCSKVVYSSSVWNFWSDSEWASGLDVANRDIGLEVFLDSRIFLLFLILP